MQSVQINLKLSTVTVDLNHFRLHENRKALRIVCVDILSDIEKINLDFTIY